MRVKDNVLEEEDNPEPAAKRVRGTDEYSPKTQELSSPAGISSSLRAIGEAVRSARRRRPLARNTRDFGERTERLPHGVPQSTAGSKRVKRKSLPKEARAFRGRQGFQPYRPSDEG